jgi:hypothetical protein
MIASQYGRHEVIHTLLQGGADINAKDEVRNQMMMMMMIVINDEDRDDGVDNWL